MRVILYAVFALLSSACGGTVDVPESGEKPSVSQGQCSQYSASANAVCPSTQFFVLSCTLPVPNPARDVDCIPGGFGGITPPPGDPSSIWCCK